MDDISTLASTDREPAHLTAQGMGSASGAGDVNARKGGREMAATNSSAPATAVTMDIAIPLTSGVTVLVDTQVLVRSLGQGGWGGGVALQLGCLY